MELLELVLPPSVLIMMNCNIFCSAIQFFSQMMPRSVGVMHSPSVCKGHIQAVLAPNSMHLVLMAVELTEDCPCWFLFCALCPSKTMSSSQLKAAFKD